MVARKTLEETKNDDFEEGVKILKNEAFDNEMGQGVYTDRLYYLGSRIPWWIRNMAPRSSLVVEELFWNSYPRLKTEYKSEFLGERLIYEIESMHIEDDGSTDNALGLDDEKLKARKIEKINLLSDDIIESIDDSKNPRINPDTSEYLGDLSEEWMRNREKYICCYKCTTINIDTPFQSRLEKLLMENAVRAFTIESHLELLCWSGIWLGMSETEIIEYEAIAENQTNEAVQDKIKT